MNRLYFVSLALCLSAPLLAADDIVIDWESRKLKSFPSIVNDRTQVDLVIENINDLLYRYETTVTATARPIDDAALLFGATVAKATENNKDVKEECNGAAANVTKALKGSMEAFQKDELLYPAAKPPAGKKYESQPLSKSLKAWGNWQTATDDRLKSVANDIYKLRSDECQANQAAQQAAIAYDAFLSWRQTRQDIVNGGHEIRIVQTLYPDYDYSIRIREIVDGPNVVTEKGEKTFEVKPQSGVMSLSLGTLLTAAEQRSYVQRPVPHTTTTIGDDGQMVSTLGVQNQLFADSTSPLRPQGVALLNYRFPWTSKLRPAGVLLSAGPVLDFGSSSVSTSRLGFFAGVTVSLWDRLFITPGMHLSEFADFPAGFTQGAVVPDNFGDATPLGRWTRKFAVSISFRTAKFNAGSKTTSSASTDGGTQDEE
ncbi:MAG: hypothetical protein KDC27_14845 [Acidobacteria bacterium]|nr:hypothetical protein [Acidobacteriota bacterium]